MRLAIPSRIPSARRRPIRCPTVQATRRMGIPMVPGTAGTLIVCLTGAIRTVAARGTACGRRRRLWGLIAEDQDRDKYCQRREQQHEEPRHQDRSPTCPVEAARPRQRPKARQTRTYPFDPVLLVVGADRNALRRERCNLHGVEDPLACAASRRTVVGQRRPRGDKTVVGRNRIVVPLRYLRPSRPVSCPWPPRASTVSMCSLLISPAKRARAAASAAAPSDSKITIAGVLAASCAVNAMPAGVAPSRASSQKSPTFGGSSGSSGVTGTYAGPAPGSSAEAGMEARAGPRFVRRSGWWLCARHHTPSRGLDPDEADRRAVRGTESLFGPCRLASQSVQASADLFLRRLSEPSPCLGERPLLSAPREKLLQVY